MTEHNARPLTSAVRLCVKGRGPLDADSLAVALTEGDVRRWVMDELVVGSEALASVGREILEGAYEHVTGTMRGIPSPSSVYVDDSIGPDGWFVRGGRA